MRAHRQTLKFQTTAICFATFLGDVCTHSDQESGLSGGAETQQHLEPTGKMCVGQFFFFFASPSVYFRM